MLGRSCAVPVFEMELLREYLDDCNDHRCRHSWKHLNLVSETEWLTWTEDSGNEGCSIVNDIRALKSVSLERVLGRD